MGYNKVDICGVDTSQLPRIKKEDAPAIWARIKAGDKKAREEFLHANLRLVLSIIQKFSSRADNPDDLFQIGCIGLIKAMDNFDLSHNVQFSTYAVPMIIGEIRRYLRDNGAMRVSRSVRDIAFKALAIKERLTRENEAEPTIDEIARAMELPKEQISAALDAIQTPVSIHEPVYHDGGDTSYIADQLKDTKNTDEKWINKIAINDAFKKLNLREKNILDMRFYDGKTQAEVASEIGISQAQVSRLEKGALKILKDWV